MKILYLIPARGGSKGIPYKNIKKLAGKPLIYYAIDAARELTSDENICISTDDAKIIRVVEDYGLKVPFVRPDALATDKSGSNGVIKHAVAYYSNKGINYDAVVLLQPTSPFRSADDIRGCIREFDGFLDMVVSVKSATSNPYYNCFEESSEGYLKISKGDGKYQRRQDVPDAWEYNGAVYVINTRSLKEQDISDFVKIKKFVMNDIHSLDLDTMLDWKVAEMIITENLLENAK